MEPGKQNKMAGKKDCNDGFAALIIIALNSLLLIMTILGLVGIIYVWVMQSDIPTGGEQALSVAIPEFILVTAIFLTIVVMSISLFGIIATALQMKENKHADDVKKMPELDEKDGKQNGKLAHKKHPCCHLWGLGVYVFLCILAFFFLLAVAVVCGVYSDKMTQFNSLDKVRDKGDGWLDTFEDKLSTQVLKLSDKYPKTWNSTQEAIGCCGWNLDNGNITAFTNSKCCQDNTMVNSVNVIGKINLDYAGCKKDSDENVYTCEGIVATYIQGNLVKASISAAALAFVQLALAICGCVVRYPKLFKYCGCKTGKASETVSAQSSETQVQPLHKTKSGGFI